MIISVAKLKQLVPTAANIDDNTLQAQLEGLESLIRAYTNNNFQNRNVRIVANAQNDTLNLGGYTDIQIGDTVEISKSRLNNGVYTYALDGMGLKNEEGVLVTKVEYPKAVQMGTVNLWKWDNDNRVKVGIQSESLSRYSVTYFNMDGDNSVGGYPRSLMGFLKPYIKAQC